MRRVDNQKWDKQSFINEEYLQETKIVLMIPHQKQKDLKLWQANLPRRILLLPCVYSVIGQQHNGVANRYKSNTEAQLD